MPVLKSERAMAHKTRQVEVSPCDRDLACRKNETCPDEKNQRELFNKASPFPANPSSTCCVYPNLRAFLDLREEMRES